MEAMPGTDQGTDQNAAEWRREIKFVAYDSERHKMQHWLKVNRAGFSSPYPDRTVCNIYFDTMELSAYAENLSGVASRSKVRYRWYGNVNDPCAGALEIKRKQNQLGWKIRYPVERAPYSPGADWRDIRAALMEQLPADGRYWLQQASLPVLVNRYRRQYFVSADKSIRVTIDTDNMVWDQRIKRGFDVRARSRSPRLLIVEFKFGAERRETVSDVLMGIPIRVSRWSKYVNGVASFNR